MLSIGFLFKSLVLILYTIGYMYKIVGSVCICANKAAKNLAIDNLALERLKCFVNFSHRVLFDSEFGHGLDYLCLSCMLYFVHGENQHYLYLNKRPMPFVRADCLQCVRACEMTCMLSFSCLNRMKWALNQWYSDFYDLLGAANNGDDEINSHGVQEVWRQLWWFCAIVSPAIVVHPLGKWISSIWRYSWRVALIRSYLAHWNTSCSVCEGAAQRIHEDTLKFEQGVYYCFATALDSLFTLLVFVPVLWNVGEKARWEWWDWPGWLFTIALISSIGGLFVSACIGWKLVYLEIQNQRVEAKLRTFLVWLETDPLSLADRVMTSITQATTSFKSNRVSTDQTRSSTHELKNECSVEETPSKAFVPVLQELWENYKSLYSQFAKFDVWIAFFDQSMVVLPYFLVAPLLYATPPRRITLGILVKTTNAFDKVFNAFAILTNNWAQVNEWRSCLHRLKEFEREIYSKRPYDHTLLLSTPVSCNGANLDEYTTTSSLENISKLKETHSEVALSTISVNVQQLD